MMGDADRANGDTKRDDRYRALPRQLIRAQENWAMVTRGPMAQRPSVS